jgi:glycosyltransferase involved in cell wall biosynthesis
MKTNSSIVYLWAEVTGYVLGVLEELAQQTTGSIDVVHWDKKTVNSTRFEIGQSARIRFHRRTQASERNIYDLLVQRQPDIIVVSGWMDKGYIAVCMRYKRFQPNVKIVAGIDAQWTGSLRQRIGQIYYRIFYRWLFDFMWVSGKPQFSFAMRYGYGIDTIISNLYSADTGVFNALAAFRKRFVFVGRFVKIKALDLLIDAYSHLPAEKQKEWPLVLVGEGDQKEMILSKRNPNIEVLPFMQPEDLRSELLKGGIACLTSYDDHWGVVIHEYALMGMPMLLSSGCGAATEFLIPGYNGFMFKTGDLDSLYVALERFTMLSDAEIGLYGHNSAQLGARIDNKKSAKSLLSVTYL